MLCCTGMYDETHVLLLQGDKAQDGTISGYTVQLLDLCSFDIEQLCAFKRENAPGSAADGSERLDFLSADPLVIHDALSGVLYMPGSTVGAVVIPGYLRDAVPFLMGGRLFLSSDRGILYEIAGDGSISAAWTLPCEYGAFTPVIAGREGKLTFATYSRKDPSLQVYVDVDPLRGESEPSGILFPVETHNLRVRPFRSCQKRDGPPR